jgi:hypothetical protein
VDVSHDPARAHVALEIIFAEPTGMTTPGRPSVVGLSVPSDVDAAFVGHEAFAALPQLPDEYADATPNRPASFGVALAETPVTTPARHSPHACWQAVEAWARPVATGSVAAGLTGRFDPLRTASIPAVAPPSGLAAEVESPVTAPSQPSGQSSEEPVCAEPATPGIQVALRPRTCGVARPVWRRVLATASEPTPQVVSARQRPAEWEWVFAASPAPLVYASLTVRTAQSGPPHWA